MHFHFDKNYSLQGNQESGFCGQNRATKKYDCEVDRWDNVPCVNSEASHSSTFPEIKQAP